MRSLIATTTLILLLTTGGTGAQVYQLRHWSGQGLAPVYEGFDVNPDGTYNMWFGYMNRNFEEELDVPVGGENRFDPGPADRGQPTHFDTRRHKDVFRVVVPKDFGDANKIVWGHGPRQVGVDRGDTEPRLADRSQSHDARRQQPEHRFESPA